MAQSTNSTARFLSVDEVRMNQYEKMHIAFLDINVSAQPNYSLLCIVYLGVERGVGGDFYGAQARTCHIYANRCPQNSLRRPPNHFYRYRQFLIEKINFGVLIWHQRLQSTLSDRLPQYLSTMKQHLCEETIDSIMHSFTVLRTSHNEHSLRSIE